MADENALNADLLAVLAKHGVEGLPARATAGPKVSDGSDKAIGAYITSIITGSSAFDAAVLDDVTRTLRVGTQAARGGGG